MPTKNYLKRKSKSPYKAGYQTPENLETSNEYETKLLKAINYSTVKRSTRELAQATEMDWETASKYLNNLKEKGKVKAIKIGVKTVWKIT